MLALNRGVRAQETPRQLLMVTTSHPPAVDQFVATGTTGTVRKRKLPNNSAQNTNRIREQNEAHQNKRYTKCSLVNDATSGSLHLVNESGVSAVGHECSTTGNNENKRNRGKPSKSQSERAKEHNKAQREKYSVKPGCSLSCKRKCLSKIPDEKRQEINGEFWSMSHYERHYFMLHATKRKKASRKTCGTVLRRKHSYFYFLNGTDWIKSVCKTFFLTTHGFQKNNDTALQNCLKSTALDSIKPGIDRRGKTPSTSKIDRSVITNHIETFSPAVSHYRREHAPQRRYLPTDVTIKAMHQDFMSKHKTKCCYPVYRQVVCEMKISFVNWGRKNARNAKSLIYMIHITSKIPCLTTVLFAKTSQSISQELAKPDSTTKKTQIWMAPVSVPCFLQTWRKLSCYHA